MAIQLELGLDVIRSYKRLNYTPWHAIAEFVDNSTQSYFNARAGLSEAYDREGAGLEVAIVYDRENGGMLRIADNAMGMSLDELNYALHVGNRPAVTTGRSKFGMGMKTAACWIGNQWSVKTKKLGEVTEHSVHVDVERVADGFNELPYERRDNRPPEDHYTILEIIDHNRVFHGRTLGKIRQFLSSMYRQDLRAHCLDLRWQDEQIDWRDSDDDFLKARDGTPYRREFSFEVQGKRVYGWVGILERGSRSKAGFSILHADRVVRGWPDSWRPEEIYGQFLGSNDLVNQRLVGEIHLDEFEVSHTKDDILWLGTEEDEVQEELRRISSDYIVVAKTRRRATDDERGPSDVEIQTAVEEIQQELSSAELADLITVETVPPPDVVSQTIRPLLEMIVGREPAYAAGLAGLNIRGYLGDEMSANDPYVVVDSTTPEKVLVIVNLHHPHVEQLQGSEGFLNYLRHCTYDAIAEWQARHRASTIDPDTIKMLKDRLLRVPMAIETHMLAEAGVENG